MKAKFALGDKVKDKVTGYKGTITSICFSLNRPVSYCVEGMDTTGRPISDWVDENRLKLDNGNIDNNKYNEIPKEKLNDIKDLINKDPKEPKKKEEEHDCEHCELAPICFIIHEIISKKM